MKRIASVVVLAALMASVTGCGAVGSMMSKVEKEVSEYYKARYGEVEKFEIAFDSFKDVDIDMPVGEVKIEEGDSYSLKYMYPKKVAPKYRIENDTLEIRGKDVRALYGDHEPEFSLTVTVPKDADINVVTINCGMGNLAVNGISGKKLDIDTNMGDITANNDTFETVVLSNSMGDVNLYNITADTLNGATTMGSAKISYSTIEDVNWNSSMGDVDLFGNYDNIRISDSMGNIDVNSEKDWKGVLCTSMGYVTVNGQDNGESYEQ